MTEYADTDPNMEAIARGLASAQGDAAEAKTLLRGGGTNTGLITDLRLLQSDVRNVDNRLTETREMFSLWHSQHDRKMDTLTVAVKAATMGRLPGVVTALVVVCIVVITLAAVAGAASVTDAVRILERIERRPYAEADR